MSNRLSRFRAKSMKVTLKGDDKELDIQGLTFPELTDFAELVEDRKTKQALDFLLYTGLRNAILTKEENPAEGMTDDEIKEEIKHMDSGTSMEIIGHIKKMSNLPEAPEEDKKKD